MAPSPQSNSLSASLRLPAISLAGLCVIFFLTALSLDVVIAQEISTLLASGDRANRSYNTRAAITWYEKAESAEQDHYETLIRLARAYNDLGRLALRRSDSAEYFYRRGLAYAERIAKAYPDSSSSWLMLALCHGSLAPFKSLGDKLELGRDVRENALRAAKLDTNAALPHVVLGIFYRAAARLKWWERTLVNTILGKDFEGTIEQAEGSIRKAIELEPKNPYAWYELCWIHRSRERTAEAASALKTVISIPPTNERERRQVEDAERQLDRLTLQDAK